jgi:ribosome maturation factor RimP
MLNKDKIAAVVEKYIGGTDKYLVDIDVTRTNVVDVYVDGDEGITISECVDISRFIESNFDRDLEDYELRVSSPGLDKPFRLRRQYGRYINREVRLVLKGGGEIIGKLTEYTDDKLVLQTTGKKKKNEERIVEVVFEDVREGWPVVSFRN